MTANQWQHVKELFDAALQRSPETRAQFLRQACGNDEALLRELESLLAEDDAAQTFLEPTRHAWGPDVAAREPGPLGALSQVGPYRLLRPIGRGGMADVYLAARSDHLYRRFVAVKVVRSTGIGDASSELVSRFRHERQALAILDHPNIVKLLDGGTTEHGVPYLVMDYVRGTPIDEYCERNRCSVPERLRLFCTICEAVHYAHQNLIVHRDLKPSNIVVTPEGVPKLLDFGIAKLLQPELWSHTIGLTRSEMRLMTPAYASPEQLRGEPITTATDVYSLGVLLYELLTGHSPYPGKQQTPLELERAICDLQPEKPSTAIDRVEEKRSAYGEKPIVLSPDTVSASREGTSDKLRRRLKGELDTIVLMALRKEPQRRYASAEQFADDIQRHLKGVPVIACKDTFRYRSGKFIRRHTVALAATAAVMLLLIAAAAIAWSQSRAALAQHARAERRFNEVRALARFTLFEFDDALRSGATRARTVVIAKALDYLDGLADDAADDLSLQRELIEGYLKVGDLQGNLYGPNLGDQKGARKSYEQALKIAEAVRKADAANPASGRDVARANQKLGEWMSMSGDSTDAVKRLGSAVEVFEAIARQRPADVQSQRDLLSAWERLGATQYTRGDLDAALQSYERYGAIARQMSAAEPGNAGTSRALARADEEMGKILSLSGKKDEALERLQRALAMYEALSGIDPSNASLRRAVSVTYANLGGVLADKGRPAEALTSYRQGLRALERLAREDPDNRQSQRDLALTLAFLSSVTKGQDANEAHDLSSRAIGLLRGLAEDPEASALHHREYAWVMVTTPFEDLRDLATARRHAEAAVRMTNGTDPSTLDTLANVYYLGGDARRAVDVERRAIALLPPASSSPSHSEGWHTRTELEGNLQRFLAASTQQASAKQP